MPAHFRFYNKMSVTGQQSDGHNCLKHWMMERGIRDMFFPMQMCVLDILASSFMCHFFLCPDVDT